ncbi:MAG TPA: hypothetical protein VIK18_19935, partial [Pirellulales bacterium]
RSAPTGGLGRTIFLRTRGLRRGTFLRVEFISQPADVCENLLAGVYANAPGRYVARGPKRLSEK